MKKYLLGLAVVSGLSLVASQSVAAPVAIAVAKIPFTFSAGDKQLPAGQYEILEQDTSSNVLILRNMDTGKNTLTEYLTRLAQREASDTTVVLDKIGDQYALTEIHPVGSDGYYLAGLKGKHTHVSIKAAKAAK